MTDKIGTTKTRFIGISCLFTNELEPIDSLVNWSAFGYEFNENTSKCGLLLTTTTKGLSLEQHIALIAEQSYKYYGKYRSLNVILKAAATCPNTQFVISSRDLSFFRMNNASLIIELWESLNLFEAGESEGIDSDAELFSIPCEVYGSFRVAGYTLDPDDITKLLRIEPTSSFCRDNINPRNNEVYEFGKWSVSSEDRTGVNSKSLEQNFQWLLQLLSGKRSNLRQIRELGLDSIFFMFWEADYYVTKSIITAKTLAELDTFKTDIVFDVYF